MCSILVEFFFLNTYQLIFDTITGIEEITKTWWHFYFFPVLSVGGEFEWFFHAWTELRLVTLKNTCISVLTKLLNVSRLQMNVQINLYSNLYSMCSLFPIRLKILQQEAVHQLYLLRQSINEQNVFFVHSALLFWEKLIMTEFLDKFISLKIVFKVSWIVHKCQHRHKFDIQFQPKRTNPIP